MSPPTPPPSTANEPVVPPPGATDPPRRIAHLDMDAFYASVELLRCPQLKGLPVVIGGGRRPQDEALLARWLATDRDDHNRDDPPATDDDARLAARWRRVPPDAFSRLRDYTGRGVVTTATYAARAFGVGSGQGLMQAARLCPDAVLLPVDFDAYRRASRAFKAVITDIAPVMEDRGVDEVYIDFTHVPGGQREGGRVLARLIQKSIADATGLTCSVGVAPNKLLAKMASEFHKPNGIAVLHAHELEARIWPLPVRKINGIGPKAEARLAELGIRTIGELAACPVQRLRERFGPTQGAWLADAAWGRDDRPVVTASEPVSLSRETTFERDLHAVRDREALGQIFTRLCEQLATDLQRKGILGHTVGVKLRYADFRVVTRDHRLSEPVQSAGALRHAAGQALRRAPLQRPLRLLGVRVSGLCRADDPTPPATRPARAQRTANGPNQNFKKKRPLSHVPPEQQALFF